MVQKIKHNWFRRHWIITIILIIFIIGGIGSIFSPEEQSKSSGTKTISNGNTNSAVISGNLESFFPIRSEIPTEFTSTPISDLDISKDISNIENAEGLKSVKSMGINKIEGTMSYIDVDMLIYEFSSQEQAKNYYEFFVNKIKQTGGYSEMSVSSRATCFGFTENYGISAGQFANVFCYNKNIYFEVWGASGYTLKKPNNDVKTMLSIIDGKIK